MNSYGVTLPDNTFWSDFSIAEKFGVSAVRDTAEKATKEWFSNVEMFAAIVTTLNHKLWDLYETKPELAKVYEELYFKANNKARDEYKDNDAWIYFQLTD